MASQASMSRSCKRSFKSCRDRYSTTPSSRLQPSSIALPRREHSYIAVGRREVKPVSLARLTIPIAHLPLLPHSVVSGQMSLLKQSYGLRQDVFDLVLLGEANGGRNLIEGEWYVILAPITPEVQPLSSAYRYRDISTYICLDLGNTIRRKCASSSGVSDTSTTGHSSKSRLGSEDADVILSAKKVG